MRILHSKWTYVALSGLTIIGILIFSVYAFRAVERDLYPRPDYGVQTISTAEEQYRQSFPKRGYSRTLRELGSPADGCPASNLLPPTSACLIDFVLANASSPATAKSGYFYTYIPGPPNAKGIIESYTVHGDPATPQAGVRHFFIDETGVMRVDRGKPASKDSPINDY
jgi:hypothetical protein